MTETIGLIANPASGKDVRRLVSHASTFDNAEKCNIIRRVIIGALSTGAVDFLYLPDDHGLVPGAVAALPAAPICRPVNIPLTGTAKDTELAAEAMRAAGCAVVVSLGGDGTNRALVRGWQDVPLIAISTGTNNVFPSMVEGTVAGAAAGLLATGTILARDVAARSKLIHLRIDGEDDDLALIDAALVEGAFTGSRALWKLSGLRAALLSRAESAATGISAIGGLLEPVSACDDAALFIECGVCADADPAGGRLQVRAPIAPGRYETVSVRLVRRVALGEDVELHGSGMLALDGERERRLRAGQSARLHVRRDGPWLVSVERTLRRAAQAGVFRLERGDVLAHQARS